MIRSLTFTGPAKCKHPTVDWIRECGFWLCGNCYAKLSERPIKYGPPMPNLDRGNAYPQVVVWQAEIAVVDGVTLRAFLRTIARRFIWRTRGTMPVEEAYLAAIDAIKAFEVPFGDVSFEWSHAAARQIADEEVQYWDEDNGKN